MTTDDSADIGALKRQAMALAQSNQLQEAKSLFMRIAAVETRDAEVWYSLGMVSGALDAFDEAEKYFRRATEIRNDYGEAYFHLGRALQAQKKYRDSATSFEAAIAADPENAAAHHHLGMTFYVLGELDRSETALLKAILLDPDNLEPYFLLASQYQRIGRMNDTVSLYKEILNRNPNLPSAHNNLALVMQHQGIFAEAIKHYRIALELKSSRLDVHSNFVLCSNFVPKFTDSEIAEIHRNYGDSANRIVTPGSDYQNIPDPDRRLRIGYVSPNLCMHSVAYFFEPLLAGHDAIDFEIFCYADVSNPDSVTERLRGTSAHWRDVHNKNNDTFTDLIRKDSIDILVDLAGHTAGNRLLAFAGKPAPIQVSYLGYPNTTGLASMDYRIVDQWTDPPGQGDEWYTEELIRLPRPFVCYQPSSSIPDVEPSPAQKNGFVTFGSFNNLAKMNRQVLDTWADILNAVPDSRIVLKNKPLRDSSVTDRIYAHFLSRGITEDRVATVGSEPLWLDHIRKYHQVDIVLDTFPYNGTTTTCEALTMGVPVITVCGERHSARVGTSLLNGCGLSELVGMSVDNYRGIAITLAGDSDRLAYYRESLREKLFQSPLCDGIALARAIENAYRNMWARWCREHG